MWFNKKKGPLQKESLLEGKKDRTNKTQACPKVIPGQFFLHPERCKNAENGKCHNFLYYFKLNKTELAVTNSICRDSKTIFEERNAPTGQNGHPKGAILLGFKVAIPSEHHKDIRDEKQGNGGHGRRTSKEREGKVVTTQRSDRTKSVSIILRRGIRRDH